MKKDNWDFKKPKSKNKAKQQQKNPSLYRHISFYCSLLYCTSQILHFLQTEDNTPTIKKISTWFILVLGLLRWSRTKPVSLRYACIIMNKRHQHGRSLKTWIRDPILTWLPDPDKVLNPHVPQKPHYMYRGTQNYIHNTRMRMRQEQDQACSNFFPSIIVTTRNRLPIL